MTKEKMTPAGKKIKVDDKLAEPVLIIGTIPCMNNLIKSVWKLISEAASQLAKMSGGEYAVYDVFKAVWFGHSFLYIGYMCDSKEDSEFAGKSSDNANLIIAKYITMKREKGLIGYTVVRLDDLGAHIWQAHVTKEYRGTEVFEMSVEFVVKELAAIGVKHVTFTSNRHGWGEKVKAIKFKEGMTTFHRDIEPVGIQENTDHVMV